MKHYHLKAIIERFTPTMLDVVEPASQADITQLEALTDPLSESYREFLVWMGNRCPFLDGNQLLYSPEDILEIYEDPEYDIPEGFLLIGIDTSGSSFDLHIRRADRAVVRVSEYYEAVTNEDVLEESLSFESYLLNAYVRKTLVPSHPFHTAVGYSGTDDEIQKLKNKVDEICKGYNITHSIQLTDFRFYGGQEFVLGLYQRPQSQVAYLYIGAIEKVHFDKWSDFISNWERMIKMPL